MIIREDWMTDSSYFGNDYPNNVLLLDAIDRFNEQLTSLEGRNAYVDGATSTERILVQNHTNPLNQEKYDKKCSFSLNSAVHKGSLLHFDNQYWLVVSDLFYKYAYYVASVVKCNNTLKFYNQTSILKEVPCVVSGKSINVSENNLITIPDNQYYILVPNSTDTSSIKEDKRFILSGKAYRVIGVDNISKVGLLEVRIEATTPDLEDDNFELGIANYYSNQITYEVEILNGSALNMIYPNTTLQLNCVVKKNGVIISDPSLTYTSSDTDIATVSETGLVTDVGTGDVVITVSYAVGSITVSSTINIHCDITVEDIYSVLITPSDITSVKVTKSITFTATPKKNGLTDNLKIVDWSIRNADGSSNNTYATINANDKTCVLTCGDIPNKYIILRAELQFDNTIYTDMQIRTANLF